MSDLQAAAGVALYGWVGLASFSLVSPEEKADVQGFAIGPLCLAPISEEFGRYWAYVGAVLAYGLCHLFLTL